MTAAPAMPNDVVAELRPVLGREQCGGVQSSTLSGSVSVVQPNRRTSRPKWVSTVMPGIPKRVAEHHIGGLPADAGSVTRSFIRFGTSPSKRSVNSGP